MIRRTIDIRSRLKRQKPTMEDEVAFYRAAPSDSQDETFEYRLVSLPASRNLIQETIATYVPYGATLHGAEFGAGCSGPLFQLFLPDALKPGWTQYDINPSFVTMNRKFARRAERRRSGWLAGLRRLPRIAEGNMYSMPLDDQSVDVVAGLSAWSSTFFFGQAAKEIKRVLRPGGYFFHFQDMLPAWDAVLLREADERERTGLDPSVPCDIITHASETSPGMHLMLDQVTAVVSSATGEAVPTGEYFNRQLAEACRHAGLSILVEERRTQEFLQPLEGYLAPWRFWAGVNGFRSVARPNGNTFVGKPEGYDWRVDPNLGTDRISMAVSMDVLVARKKVM